MSIFRRFFRGGQPLIKLISEDIGGNHRFAQFIEDNRQIYKVLFGEDSIEIIHNGGNHHIQLARIHWNHPIQSMRKSL